MLTQPKTMPLVPFVDKAEMNRMMDEIEARMGVVHDPEVTIEKLREMLRAEGVRPEDNTFSREIIRTRYGDDE